jgi:ATP-dependent Lhr-like helicase
VRVAPPAAEDAALGARAQRVATHLATHGASFFDDIAEGTHLLRAELEDALAELVVRGRVSCDSTAGLRALLVPPSRREARARRGRGAARRGLEDAGRWSLLRAPAAADDASLSSAAVEHVARVLLRRYGVICWRLLEREAAWLPPWRELVRVYRRLEARGEIRGGRFIAGLSGEQYALPDAVAWMREIRRRGDAARDPRLVCLAASDPANLVGGVVHGPKVPRIAGARVLWRDGVPVATSVAGEIALLVALRPDDERAARRMLTLDPAWRDATEPAMDASAAS